MRNSEFAIRNRFRKPTAYSLRPAFTMIEVLIVVAIVALLVAVMVGVVDNIETQGKIALTENSLKILDAALKEFHDITGHYPVDNWGDRDTTTGCLIAGATDSGDAPESDEVLYLQLSILPQTREIISELPEQLLTQAHNGITVQLAHDLTEDTPYLRRIVDAWGNALIYDDHDDPDRFPEITSDGADPSTTEDNITNED